MALEILSLHIGVVDLVARLLAFVEDYDCETVGALALGIFSKSLT